MEAFTRILDMTPGEQIAQLIRLEGEYRRMKSALVEISNMVDPDEIEEDEDGFTEWGVSASEAIPMAYENAIWAAQLALKGID